MNDHWLTILEYSCYREVSVSSVRRYIKSNKVKYRLEKGKYLIFVSKENWKLKKIKERSFLEERLINAQKKNEILKEENSDLRMLITLYESGNVQGSVKL